MYKIVSGVASLIIGAMGLYLTFNHQMKFEYWKFFLWIGLTGYGIALIIDGIVQLARQGTTPPSPQTTPAGSSTSSPSAEQRLKNLDDLLAKGIISQAEYMKRRGEILSEL